MTLFGSDGLLGHGTELGRAGGVVAAYFLVVLSVFQASLVACKTMASSFVLLLATCLARAWILPSPSFPCLSSVFTCPWLVNFFCGGADENVHPHGG